MKRLVKFLTGGGRVKWGEARRPKLANLLADQTPAPAWQLDQRTKTNLLIGAGIIAVGGALYFATAQGLTPVVVTNRLIALLRHTPFGPPLYIAAYATLPLLLFPASLLTIAGGLLFGAGPGLLYSVIGGNLAAFMAYRLGRRLRALQGATAAEEEPAPAQVQGIEKFVKRLQVTPFVTVLTMHCLFIPMEWVSYGAGLLGIPENPFVTATAIGILPWTTSLVLAGASAKGTLLTGFAALNPAMLAVSGVILVGTLSIAGFINWRQTQLATETAVEPAQTEVMGPTLVAA